MGNYRKISTVQDLNQALDEKKHKFILLLAGGLCRSVKRIKWADKTRTKYHIKNDIDGTKQVLTADELFDRDLTNIGFGMGNGAFLCEIG